ncbi:MAG: APC family permease [Solirubrobacteraceae bacterium]
MATSSRQRDRIERPGAAEHPAAAARGPGFERGIGLRSAVAINMTQMCGIGPFVTIPLMIAALGGPQAAFGWIVGALLALADGLVWAELGASMPGAGGTYLYLREAFQYRSGRLMPFLFVWTAMFTIPLIMATGVIGLVQYLGYLIPGMSWVEIHAISLAVVALVLFALYRRVVETGAISTALWAVALLSLLIVIVASLTNFHPHLAFTYPHNAFAFGGPFWAGLGGGLLIGIYDYLGYNTTAYMAAELKDPGRVLPRSIIISVFGIMVAYLAMNIGVLGAVPWQTAAHSQSVASLVLDRTWGKAAADITTVLIIVTAFGSIFAGLLGGSRVPYNAARDGLFFRPFARLHPRHHFPHVALLVMGAITAVGSFFTLSTVINVLLAVFVIVQAIAQVVALTVLRRRQPGLRRPYRQWLYPLPSLVALAGWIYVYKSSGSTPIIFSLVVLAAGLAAFLVWARLERQWPFGPKHIREEFLDAAAVEQETVFMSGHVG